VVAQDFGLLPFFGPMTGVWFFQVNGIVF